MRQSLCLLFLLLVSGSILAQKTLMIEKVGTSRRFFFHEGDYIKIRAIHPDTLIEGKIWAIRDSTISIHGWRTMTFSISDIKAVYRNIHFLQKLSKYAAIGGGVLFGVIVFNHLINNEQVFTNDLFIISGSFLAISGVSFLLSEQKYKTGERWKIKILDAYIK
jgi:hypothetical protein